MLLLAIIGRPLFFIFKKRIEFLGNFSFTQEIVCDIYLGVIFLYVLALIPLHLFNPLILALARVAIAFLFLLKTKSGMKQHHSRRESSMVE